MRTTLVAEGYQVSDAKAGEQALELIRSDRYDLALLDINMPGISGIETCREIRSAASLPIIMITVRDRERDKIEAFNAGADGFVTKPFTLPELLARIRALLRRTGLPAGISSWYLQLGDAKIDFDARKVTTGNLEVRLTTKEFDLLAYFAAHPNKTLAHRELLQEVWGPDYGDEQEYLRVFVNRLRKKIEALPAEPKYLVTEPWVGYRLDLRS